MKKNLSVFVLVIEIVSISLLHAIKIRQSEKGQSSSSSNAYGYSKQSLPPKQPYLLVRVK